MAFVGSRVLLGYEEEPITEKYVDQVDYTTNKIGGTPNWMTNTPPVVTCKLCGLKLPLVIQIYAPLKNSIHHRTLYIFACVNPKCWNNSESWVCLRDQKEDVRPTASYLNQPQNTSTNAESWISGSDDWGDEQNGNLVADLTPIVDDISQGVSDMSVDETNANVGDGAVGTGCVAVATIEGDEGEVVCVESPIAARDNIAALLEQAMDVPQIPESGLEFSSAFVSVEEEDLKHSWSVAVPPVAPLPQTAAEEDEAGAEQYEKSLPAHGDRMFHQFVTKINAHPGQIIRYGGSPLWLYPDESGSASLHCRNCGGQASFEMQLLPTLISKLAVSGSCGHLEFGSVFIFSCLAGCWDSSSGPRAEIVVVQREKM